jgi:hypothetical protein
VTQADEEADRFGTEAVAGVQRADGVDLASLDPIESTRVDDLFEQWRRAAVADLESAGHAGFTTERLCEPEHFIKPGGDKTTVQAPGRALVLTLIRDAGDDPIANEFRHNWW